MRPGDHLGEYVLMERMGEGGFGEVWRAENADLPGRSVAIKVAKDPSYVAALKQEAELLHRLDHPNVVRLLTIHAASDPPYLVLEHVRGESLRQAIDRKGKLPVEASVSLVLEVLAGLSAAHQAGLVHRDVKPSNVLIGADGRPKLADFGLGRAVRTSGASVQLSAQGTLPAIVGTLDYMSPEQRRGEAGDARSDLYACGVLLYEAIAGSPRPIRLPVSGAPTALSKVIERAVSVDPSARFESAAALAAALRSSVLLPEVPGAPRGQQAAMPAPERRPRPATSVAMLMAFVAMAIFGFTSYNSRDSQSSSPGVARPTQAPPLYVPPSSNADEDVARAPAIVVLPAALRHRGPIRALAFSPDGRRLATAGADGTIRLWAVPAGERLASFDLGVSASAVAFSSDGTRIVAGGERGEARIWRTDEPGSPSALEGCFIELLAVGFLEEDRSVVTVEWNGCIRIWDAATRKMTSSALIGSGLGSGVLSTAARIIAVLRKGSFELRNLDVGSTTLVMQVADPRRTLALSPDGRWFGLGHPLTAESAGTGFDVWHDSGEKRSCIIATDGASPNAAAFSPDASLVATVQNGRLLRLWSLPHGRPRTDVVDTTMTTTLLAFSSDSTMLALAGDDGARLVVMCQGPDADWSQPLAPATGAPRLVASVAMPGAATAERAAILRVEVRNDGGGVSCQLWARLETDDARVGGACLFGAVHAGQTFTRTIVARIPADRPAGPLAGRVRFSDADGYAPSPLDVRLDVKEAR